MTSMSKRQQARTEKDLQDVLRSVPGNNQCADCQVRNPGWASWNLGIFLCMRCASIHRKLGTHITKVKSLSMDTWTPDQVENMKRNGNAVVNKLYNPKNRRPDIPLDADEVDSAMERYIRKKYQEKSLSDGKPKPPSRTEDDMVYTRSSASRQAESDSPEASPPPLPSKKGKFFGFGLRAVSSAYPLSKHDKKNLPREPVVDRAFRISSDNYTSRSPQEGRRSKMSEKELQEKLARLREMGFTYTRRNTTVLEGLNGDVERSIEALVRLGKNDRPSVGGTPTPPSKDNTSRTVPFPSEVRSATLPAPETSNNPYGQSPNLSSGLSFSPSQPQLQEQQQQQFTSSPVTQRAPSTNPFDTVETNQADAGLKQAFQNMQISQSLFPHSTGGYPAQPPPIQDPRFQHSMTPPARQYGFIASPSALPGNTNPFFQTNQTRQMTANNPYANMPTSQPQPQPQTANPFFNQQSQAPGMYAFPQQQPQQQSSTSGPNPFGIPPQSPPQQNPQLQAISQTHPIFANNQQLAGQQFQPQPQFQQQPQFPQQSHFMPQQPQMSAPLSSFTYGQPQQPLFQAMQSHPPQQFQYQQPQPLMPQQTGRIDKSSIMALYNYPQLAPPPLASIPEPTNQGMNPSQLISPAPTSDIFSGNPYSPQKRSATMPVNAMHSASGTTSRNPFFQSANSSATSTPMPGGNGIRHISAESVSINHLENGRHSPDAFANLSARYMG